MLVSLFGAWTRYFANTSYTILLAGQYLCAFAQTVILFVPVRKFIQAIVTLLSFS